MSLDLDMLILFVFQAQELIGSAEPAVPGDELDVTLPEKAVESGAAKNPEVSQEHEHVTLAETPSGSSEGLNLLQKVTFIGVIIAIIAMFLRTRKSPGLAEKSNA